MSPAFLVNYLTRSRQITNVKVDRWLSSIFSGKIYVKKQFEKFVLYVVCKRSRRWCNNLCFFKGYCKVNGTASIVEDSPIKRYGLLNIVKTNIPLRIKENIVQFYFYYINYWFTRSNNEIHMYTGKHR
jgi:hypothetical protein